MENERQPSRRRFPQHALMEWWDKEKRDLPWRRDPSPWGTWVSEVMLQQTRVDTVIPYFLNFLQRFPDPVALAAAEPDRVMKAWEGLGYYQRARNLARAAGRVAESHQGIIPSDPALFAMLPGVGPYINAAVMSIAFGHPLPAVDGNVKRVVARYRGDSSDIQTPQFLKHARCMLERVIPKDRPGDFNEAMMELGALICQPRNPKCEHCPLAGSCRAHALNLTGDLPFRAKRIRPPLRRVSAAVVVRNGRLLIRRRPAEGLLGGMWEFPDTHIRAGESPAQAAGRLCREELKVDGVVGRQLAEVSHAYSHFRVRIHYFPITDVQSSGSLPGEPESLRWVRAQDLESYPFHQANRKAFPAIRPHSELFDIPFFSQ